jgi:hypothetical protein
MQNEMNDHRLIASTKTATSLRLKQIMNALFVLLLAIGGTTALTGCEDKGPAEKAGEKIDEAVEETGDAVEDAADEIEDEADGS